ncbi:hypothetical protein AsAng_0003320 [Aureispira anguillae]|uniref:Uncharacterized protein n=1 Tax=Aureispira anguillae TaxID=2864201 RepID=A0A915VKD2_9BACT|nr:hypothetical protein AsAng_0003320 [Aureispira anguillae]
MNKLSIFSTLVALKILALLASLREVAGLVSPLKLRFLPCRLKKYTLINRVLILPIYLTTQN